MTLSPNTSYSAETPSASYLKIRPKELAFHPPFTGVIGNEIRLINTSEHILAYKVKTTAPARYCVRPNTGIIPPGKTIEVRIFLNCTKEKDLPPLSMKTKDKFQILCIVVEDPSSIDPKSIWLNASPESIMKHKLKTVFTLPPNVEQTASPSPSNSKTYLQQHQQPQPQQQQQQDSGFKSNNTIFAEVQNMENDSDKSTFTSTVSTKSASSINSGATTSESDKSPLISSQPTLKKRTTTNIESDDPIKLRNIIKELTDKIEKLESSNKDQQSTSTQRKANFDSIQTLIVILVIAVVSFIFGRLL